MFDDIDNEIAAALNTASMMDDPFAVDPFADDLFAIDPFTAESHAPQTSAQLPKPLIMSKRDTKRRMIANLKKEALHRLIPDLPDEDEVIWRVTNGDGREQRMGAVLIEGFDYGDFVPVLADRLGHGAHCHISTWVCNRQHATTFVEMLDTGRLNSMAFVSDPYFARKPSTAAIWATLVEGFKRHALRARAMTFANHAKILCLSNADRSRFVTVTGSANLTSVMRAEQFTISGSRELYEFFVREFFEVMLRKHV